MSVQADSESQEIHKSSSSKPWIQLVAGVVGMMMISSLQYMWTPFVPSFTQTFKWPLPAVQMAFTIFIVFMTYLAPLTGYLLDRFGTRPFFTLAAFCVGIGWSGLGLVKSLSALYGFYGLAGVGASFVYTGGIATALKWFPQRRGLASGVMAAGFGSGAAPLIPLFGYLLARYGYKTTFLWTGIGFGVILLIVAQVLHFPSEALTASVSASPAAAPKVQEHGLTPLEMLKSPQFYLIYVIFVAMASGFLMVTAQAKPFAQHLGIAANIFILAVTLHSIGNGLGRVVWGFLSDKLGRENAMVIDFLICAAAVALLPVLGRNPIFFVLLIVVAMFSFGPIFAFFPPITADRFGTAYLATNYGLVYSAKGVGGIVGGVICSSCMLWIGWTFTFYGAAALAVLAALGALILKRVSRPDWGKAIAPAGKQSFS
ncbi:MAG: oxalate/formate MFS antiporter [Desulfobaccales bacterium]